MCSTLRRASRHALALRRQYARTRPHRRLPTHPAAGGPTKRRPCRERLPNAGPGQKTLCRSIRLQTGHEGLPAFTGHLEDCRPLGIQLRSRIIQEAESAVRRYGSAAEGKFTQFHSKSGRPLLAARAEGRGVHIVHAEPKIVSMGADQRHLRPPPPWPVAGQGAARNASVAPKHPTRRQIIRRRSRRRQGEYSTRRLSSPPLSSACRSAAIPAKAAAAMAR